MAHFNKAPFYRLRKTDSSIPGRQGNYVCCLPYERVPPDLVLSSPGGSSPERLIDSVLATLTSEKTKQAYSTALTDFLPWTAERGEPLNHWSKPGAERLWPAGCPSSSISEKRCPQVPQ